MPSLAFNTQNPTRNTTYSSNQQVTGIITRVDLLPESLRAKFAIVSRQAAEAGRLYYARRRSPYQIPPELGEEEGEEEEGEGWMRRMGSGGAVEGEEDEEDGSQVRVL